MLSSILQSILFKLLTNKDYYKLLTVCQGNDLHFLKKPLDIQFLKLLLSLWIMKDYWDDRFFAWLYDPHLEVGSSYCLSLCWESGSLPWSPLFHAHGCTCSGLWPQTCPGTHPCSGPELGVWKGLAHWQSEELYISLGLLHFTSFLRPAMSAPSIVSLFPPTSVLLCCAQSSFLPIF